MPHPGEPLWLLEDTAAAIALAEEEADQCPQCGMPKAWCRDNKNGRARFEVDEGFCWATYQIAQRQEALDKKKPPASMRAATTVAAKFREGYEPDVGAGLGLDSD